jgi:flagellar basal-body rod protein FlgB
MSFNGLPLIGMIQQKMSWLNDRQTILARNIANASTPGFVPQDLRANDFASALAGANAAGLSTTNALHIQPPGMVSGARKAVKSPDSRSSPDGNAVVIEEQMLKVSATQIDYAQAAGLYKKMTGMWRMAIGGAQ